MKWTPRWAAGSARPNAERESGAVPEQAGDDAAGLSIVGDAYRARVLDTISPRLAPIGWGHGAA